MQVTSLAAFANKDWGMTVTVTNQLGHYKIAVTSGKAVKEHYRDTLRDAIALALDIVGAS